MAMGKAVVSTSLGVEGLPVVAGEHLLLADAPASFSGAVNLLLGDAARRRQLGEAARRLVYPHYSAEHAARQFDRICRHTVERRGQPPVSPAAGPPVAGADPTLCQALRS
jgi:glycosyltransferase involved in cell wall biosynthesis